ncbi:MAG: class I adenylate cyclase, partial [Marinobacter sp.]
AGIGRLWVVDECGSIWSRSMRAQRRSHLISPLLRFMDNLVERRLLRQFDMAGPIGGICCHELVRRGGRWLAEPRPEQQTGAPLPGFDVQAVGVRQGDGSLQFDIFCRNREFTAEEYGEQLIPAVAHYIRSLRRSDESYPIYLTDLHLPHDLEPQQYQRDIQTCQYLHYRSVLEDALNRHLR